MRLDVVGRVVFLFLLVRTPFLSMIGVLTVGIYPSADLIIVSRVAKSLLRPELGTNPKLE